MAKPTRRKLTRAVQAWQNLSIEERQHWTNRAAGTGLTGFNQFIKRHMKN